MGLRINTNTSALVASRQTKTASERLNETLKQLGTLKRINQAADDASGLAIAERFNTQARQYQTEMNNLQSGVSAIQTADGALTAQQGATARLRELSLQAANGTLTDGQRQALNAEAQQLVQSVGDMAQGAQYNGRQLLTQTTTVDLGTQGGNQVNLTASTPAGLGLNTLDLSTAAGAQAALSTIDTAAGMISTNRSSLGAQQNGLASAINQRQIGAMSATQSESFIRDVDIARGATDRARNQILLQSGISAIAQSNIIPQTAVQLLGT